MVFLEAVTAAWAVEATRDKSQLETSISGGGQRELILQVIIVEDDDGSSQHAQAIDKTRSCAQEGGHGGRIAWVSNEEVMIQTKL